MVVLLAVLSACSPGGDDEQLADPRDALTPTYEPAGSEGQSTPDDDPDGSGSGNDGPSEDPSAPDAGSTAPPPGDDGEDPSELLPGDPGDDTAARAERPATTSSMTDPVRDPTPAVTTAPRPAWADLAGGTLTIAGDAVDLRIRLAAEVPATAPDDEHTMNVASFFDVDGDGRIDYEIWLNLGDGGWGPGYFGPTGARFGDDDGVDITHVGAELVVRFPRDHLGGARQLRWSLASEWGRYEAMGTDAMARDQAPDDGQPVTHPS